ncbi:hypothetical protein FACS1894105_10750 [Clostridia bacterium]|nr:hypothetical protein FACS1894105_10750 [Clostridia bacterium]
MAVKKKELTAAQIRRKKAGDMFTRVLLIAVGVFIIYSVWNGLLLEGFGESAAAYNKSVSLERRGGDGYDKHTNQFSIIYHFTDDNGREWSGVGATTSKNDFISTGDTVRYWKFAPWINALDGGIDWSIGLLLFANAIGGFLIWAGKNANGKSRKKKKRQKSAAVAANDKASPVCQTCGQKLTNGAAFCENCGAKL